MGNDSMSYFNNIGQVATFVSDAADVTSFVMDHGAARLNVGNFDSAAKLLLVRDFAVVFGTIAGELQPLLEIHRKATSPVAQAEAMMAMKAIIDANASALAVYATAKQDAKKRPSKPELASQLWFEATEYAVALNLHATHVSL